MSTAAAHGFQISLRAWGAPAMPAPPARARRVSQLVSATPGVGNEAGYLRGIAKCLWGNEALAPPESELCEELARSPVWLDEVYSLVARGMPDEAIDVLFDHVDELLLAGEFERCNDLVHAVDLERLDSNLMVALLSITLPAAQQLRDRPRLVQRVERRLRELAPDRIEGLMSGLR